MAFVRNSIRVDGNALRIMRIVHGLSQRELGQRAGIPPHKVFKFEHEIYSPTEEELGKLLGALGTEGQL